MSPMLMLAAALVVGSPGGVCRLSVDVDGEGAPIYSLIRGDMQVILPSRLGFETRKASFAGGFAIEGSERASFDEVWRPVWGEEDEIRDRHEELLVKFSNRTSGVKMNVRFRLFDDGLGFRYEFPNGAAGGSTESFLRVIAPIVEELTEFRLPCDPTAWWIPCDFESQEYDYNVTRASEIERTQSTVKLTGSAWDARGPKSAVQTALQLKYPNGLYVNIHEAACSDFATLNLDWDSGRNAFRALLTPSPDGSRGRLRPPCVTPWRTVIASDRATDILASRITLNLNEPCRIADTSWIKPCKYVGVWWEMMAGDRSWSPVPGHPELHPARTDNALRYIDFAAKYGFPTLLIEGWNIPYGARSADGRRNVASFSETYADVDFERIAAYAKEKGVSLCIHSETSAGVRAFERVADEHFDFVRSHGGNSVKMGYVAEIDPDGLYHYSQAMNDHYLFAVKKAAEHKVMVNQHEAVRPTGLCRTWPNLICNEAARGQEFDSFGHVNTFHTTVLPFTRLIGGPMDYTPGIVEPNLKSWNPKHPKTFMSSTVSRQLALYVVMASPLQMAADLPEHYERNQDLFEFIREVPVDWSKSIYLSAEPGDHVLTARRGKGTDDWYVGCSVGEKPYVAKFGLGFLKRGVTYWAKLWADSADASWNGNPKGHVISERKVTADDAFEVPCVAGGGFALAIRTDGGFGRTGDDGQ